ncbi:nicotinamide N-methyltransferase-like isoform X1 [Carcharodon carcharias]|uniref:nicotinamide N-methyltransferase-like isoform X1 n=1 Tax=Carcharodon carcharias TaxID=13397 RepID=UPI001B7EEFC2|nr:nicotinamide N-methyltransferase-like isoform X1 [Carcharodon carcharias]
MELGFTSGNCYEKKFNSRVYLETYYVSPLGNTQEKEFLPFILKNLVKAFSSGPKFRTLLEIGCGPCLHLALCALGHAEEIVLSDFASNNRQEIQLWLQNDPGAFDWSPIAKFVCELEGNREKWAEKEKKLRDSVKQVLKCDVHQSNPLCPVELEPIDCLVTSLCLEAACKDKTAYCSALRNVTSLLKPGGVLIMISDLNETYYTVNGLKFSCLKFDQVFLENALKEAGYEIDQFEILAFPGDERSVTDCEASSFLVAHKIKNTLC